MLSYVSSRTLVLITYLCCLLSVAFSGTHYYIISIKADLAAVCTLTINGASLNLDIQLGGTVTQQVAAGATNVELACVTYFTMNWPIMNNHQCFHLKLLLAYTQDTCPYTQIPTLSPTKPPTKMPTKPPTRMPTKKPTKVPTRPPTRVPTKNPTHIPTRNPTKSPIPTSRPTVRPTNVPNTIPTFRPTTLPTRTPSRLPTARPSYSPTRSPIKHPTLSPTRRPTLSPTERPTLLPTKLPSHLPSRSPTLRPTTASPTRIPSRSPTRMPTPPPSPAVSVTTHLSTTPDNQQLGSSKNSNTKLKSLILIGGIVSIVGILTFCVVIAIAYCCFHRARKPLKRIELEAIIGTLQVTDESTEKKEIKEGEIGPSDTLIEDQEGGRAHASEEKDGNETHEIDLMDEPLATAGRREAEAENSKEHQKEQSDEFVDTLKDVLMVNEMLERDLLDEVENARNTPQGE